MATILPTDPAPAPVNWGTYRAVADTWPTYTGWADARSTYTDCGFVGAGRMESA